MLHFSVHDDPIPFGRRSFTIETLEVAKCDGWCFALPKSHSNVEPPPNPPERVELEDALTEGIMA